LKKGVLSKGARINLKGLLMAKAGIIKAKINKWINNNNVRL
jgi:hypothetical protein